MPDPILLPSIALLSGGGLLAARDYLRRRLDSTEDRYMALYGKSDWDASNMDLAIHCAPELDEPFKQRFLERVQAKLVSGDEAWRRMWCEEADLTQETLVFVQRANVTLDDLIKPRRGLYLDLAIPGRVRVVWNHMQFDGVGMWNAVRELFDPNPPLVPYRTVPAPPPALPELLALPSVARRLVWRGRLRQQQAPGEPLTRGLAVWDAAPLRALKDELNVPFNILTAAAVIERVFVRHPDRERINIGLTAYFPFLQGRNKYGVFLCKVVRGSLESIVGQIERQTRSPLKNWGISATQSYALRQMPDRTFAAVVSRFRKKIDVLVSSLPVGELPISVGGFPAVVSCHPWELTLPYYFLLVGTRAQLHVSYTSGFSQDEGFLAEPRWMTDLVAEHQRVPNL